MWMYWGLVAVFGMLMILSAGVETEPEVKWYRKPFHKGSRISAGNKFQMEKKQGQEEK